MTRMFCSVCMSALVLTSAASGGPVVDHVENSLADDDYWERGLDINACYGFEPAPGMRKPDDCPDKVMMQGFPFYIFQGFPSDAETRAWFQRMRTVMEAILLELSMTSPHFFENVRESGVGFNIAELEGLIVSAGVCLWRHVIHLT